MKKSFTVLCFSLFSFFMYAQDGDALIINEFISTNPIEVLKPNFHDIEDIKGNVFADKDLIKQSYLQNIDIRPQEGDRLEWNNFKILKWKKLNTNKSNRISIKPSKADFQLAFVAFYLQNNDWADLELKFKSAQMLEVYIDGQLIKGNYSFGKKDDENTFEVKTSLLTNNHVVLVKMLYSKQEDLEWNLSCVVKTKNKENEISLIPSLNSFQYMDIPHLMNGIDIQSTQISAAGDFYFIKYKMTNEDGDSQSITEVKRLANHQTEQIFYGNDVYSINWSPMDNILSYTTKFAKKSWIWQYNLDNGKRYPIANDVENLSYYSWSPNGEYLVFIKTDKPNTNKSGLKKLEGMEDHWPWYQSRSNLFIYDILSGIETPLTHGYLSNSLQDISNNGRYILFSQNIRDYSERPYSKQIMIQYDRSKNSIDTLWSKLGGGNAQYSPDGDMLLITAGPTFFGDLGSNVSKSGIPNDYDTQAYLYDIESGVVSAPSKDFNPSITNAKWSYTNSDHIYFAVSEGTYKYAYVYSVSKAKFLKMELDMDVVSSIDFANDNPMMIYHGTSISTPKKAYLANIETGEKSLIDYPEENFFKKVEFGKTEDWNFTNKEGTTIEGRLYYPPNFDANKKYPMIVYYYGGTSPVERNFRGRYPKNLFAAHGYIVYVLQPSGATGYGQEFSAKHVNNWGKTVADEIISGSRLLCQTHSFIDSTKVGCMGASYGGFMTMYLTTQTDFFSAAISHAGISSISSYWGEGYWGYLYSQVASANSFPWNNKELYVEQSPLFHADKVSTPILLLHGNSDTNVPPGESRQFYTALKLLNKDVELIEIDKQDHHIKDYKKRILWQKTILAYFDKNLKKQTDWWFHLYPKKKL